MDKDAIKQSEQAGKDLDEKGDEAFKLLKKEGELYFNGRISAESLKKIQQAENELLECIAQKIRVEIYSDLEVEELRSMMLMMSLFETNVLAKAVGIILKNRENGGLITAEEQQATLKNENQADAYNEAPCS